MADQSDEIKNLFTKLGLDPSHFQQIRATPAAAPAADAALRWTLLQPATSAIQPVVIVAAPVAVATVTAIPPPRKPEPLPPDGLSLSSLSAALLGAAQDIVRAETAAQPELEEESAAPSALASALSQVSPAEGLQLLFQSVKESQAVVHQPGGAEDAPTERPTVRLPSDVLKLGNRAAASAESPARRPPEATQTLQRPLRDTTPPRSGSRLGPKPGMTVRLDQVVTAPVVPIVAEGRLRFSAPMPAPEAARGESLPDVFRRLSRRPQ